MKQNQEIYKNFKLDKFEGPLDLLLELIKEKKLNISEISLIQVVDQFVDYVNEIRKLDLDIASEYLLIASQLLEIKSRYLLNLDLSLISKHETEETENLLQRLIEYENFKKAALKLNQIFTGNITFAKDGNEFNNFLEEEQLEVIPEGIHQIEQTAFSLFNKIENRGITKQKTINLKRISLEEIRNEITKSFEKKREFDFFELVTKKIAYYISLVLFVLLEQALIGKISISQVEFFDNIKIRVLN